ncbi:MAG: ArnT family glycosyltransferase, partial [Candidatus Woesearchaeota archaeon]
MKQKIKNKLKNKNTETIILAVFLVFMTLLFAYLVSLNGLLVWDEVVYLSNARGKISESAYTENFRFPLLSTIIAGLWLITGESILSAQILMIIISIATLGVFYAISCKFLSKGIALFSTIFLAINLQFITWGYRIYTDILGVFLFLSCLLLLIISQEEKNKSNIKKSSILLFFAGILSGLAFAARLSTIIPSIIFGIFFILYKSKNKWLKSSIIFSSGFIAAISYWIINGLIHHKNPLHFAFAQASAIIEYTAAQPAILMIQHILREYSISLLLIPFSIICFSKKEKIK